MCRFKSGIILENKVVLAPEGNESHYDLLESLNIHDDYMGASKVFVRVELIPKNGDKLSDVGKWRFNVDQDIRPDWFERDKEYYEREFRNEVSVYMEKWKESFGVVVMAGKVWNAFKKEEKSGVTRTYYMLADNLSVQAFGGSNNYTESDARKTAVNSSLAQKMKEEFGDRLVPITTNLLSLDGLDDYGVVKGDLFAIPTLDLYRECRKKILNIGKSFWLVTPNSTPSGIGSDYVQYVMSGGRVDFEGCSWDAVGVRPFCILES